MVEKNTGGWYLGVNAWRPLKQVRCSMPGVSWYLRSGCVCDLKRRNTEHCSCHSKSTVQPSPRKHDQILSEHSGPATDRDHQVQVSASSGSKKATAWPDEIGVYFYVDTQAGLTLPLPLSTALPEFLTTTQEADTRVCANTVGGGIHNHFKS